MTAISRLDISSRTSAAEAARQVIRPKKADYEHTRAFFSPLVDRPPAVDVRAHDANDVAHVSRSRARALTEDLGA